MFRQIHNNEARLKSSQEGKSARSGQFLEGTGLDMGIAGTESKSWSLNTAPEQRMGSPRGGISHLSFSCSYFSQVHCHPSSLIKSYNMYIVSVFSY